MHEEPEDDFDCPMYVRHGRKYGHPLGIGAPHIPNKSEGRELRRLMQKSGETEKQVRSNVDNRRKLAVAAKTPQKTGGGKRSRYNIALLRMKRSIAREMKLPVYDPRVLKEATVELKARIFRNYGRI